MSPRRTAQNQCRSCFSSAAGAHAINSRRRGPAPTARSSLRTRQPRRCRLIMLRHERISRCPPTRCARGGRPVGDPCGRRIEKASRGPGSRRRIAVALNGSPGPATERALKEPLPSPTFSPVVYTKASCNGATYSDLLPRSTSRSTLPGRRRLGGHRETRNRASPARQWTGSRLVGAALPQHALAVSDRHGHRDRRSCPATSSAKEMAELAS